jgi:hypothetical protein
VVSFYARVTCLLGAAANFTNGKYNDVNISELAMRFRVRGSIAQAVMPSKSERCPWPYQALHLSYLPLKICFASFDSTRENETDPRSEEMEPTNES